MDLEARLKEALQGLPPGGSLPAAREEAILGYGRLQAARIRRRRRVVAVGASAGLVALVAAAAIAILVLRRQPPAPYAPADLNHDRKVDIVDAYTLALGVEAGRTPPAWDLNQDQAVDHADVEWAARQAVAISRGVR